MAQTYIEHAKLLPFDEILESEEQHNENIKNERAAVRIKKEMTNAMALERRKKRNEK